MVVINMGKGGSGGGKGNAASKMLTVLVMYLVLAIVSIFFYTKIILNQAIFNTTVGDPSYSITSVIVPIIGIAIMVGLVVGAVFLILHFVKASTSNENL
jgi:hypothetical protein